MCEFAKYFLSDLIVGSGSFPFRTKTAHYDISTMMYDDGSPALTVTRNAAITTRVGGEVFCVRRVLRNGCLPQILFAIIKRVSIVVVYQLSRFKVHYFSVHQNRFTRLFSSRVKTLGVQVPMCIPIPCGEPFEVFGVHDSVLSLCKRNQAVRCSSWLRNGVPRHSALWHGILRERILCNAAILA